MVLRADDRLGTVGMSLEKHGIQGFQGVFAAGSHAHVLLFIHRLQLRMETAEDAVHEAVGLDARPVFQLVGRDFLHVAGYVLAGIGVGAFRADDGHEFVVLVGDGYLGGLVADGVYLVIQGIALAGTGEGTIHFKQRIDGLQHGLLGLVILRAEDFRTLEHHVFQVVGQAGVVGRVVLAARTHRDVGLDAGFVLVYGHVNFEAVVQGVDFSLEGIPLHGLVLVAAGCQCKQCCGQKQNFIHLKTV